MFLVVLVYLVLLLQGSFGFRCGSGSPPAYVLEKENRRMKSIDETQPLKNQTIPIAFQVFHTTRGEGKVPYNKILKQVDMLNADFSQANLSFSISEINYIKCNEWFKKFGVEVKIEREIKERFRTGTLDVLNVFVTNMSESALGWATFPEEGRVDPKLDGIMLNYRVFPDGPLPRFQLGKTLTHEIGHWLGLLHTFHAGCDFPNDYIEDTRPQRGPTHGCPTTITTCTRQDFRLPDKKKMFDKIDALYPEDPFRNFMDYADDHCMSEFTVDQAYRMHRFWKERKSFAKKFRI